MTNDPDQAPGKEEQFKQRFAAILKDLSQTAHTNGEVMALIGSLASQLSDRFGQASWSGAKQVMSDANYNELLQSFEKQGNSLHQDGQTKKSYAIQALSASLVARSQRRDPVMAQGEKLLDALIDRSAAVYRRQMTKRN